MNVLLRPDFIGPRNDDYWNILGESNTSTPVPLSSAIGGMEKERQGERANHKKEQEMKRIISLTVILSIALLALTSIAKAGAPGLMNYQGRLTDAGGEPLDDTLSISFTIYDDATAGNAIWTETQGSVIVAEGLFNVILGSTNPIDDSVFADAARWLQITVEAEDIEPRTRLVTAAYAFHVETVDGASGGIISGDVDIQSDLTVSGKATIGPGHTNTGGYAFVAGENNTASGEEATVGGGYDNTASAHYAVVGGGRSNTASGYQATVGGGSFNIASGDYAAVGGGEYDTASGHWATVAGGANNKASGEQATVGGGNYNTASARYAVVGGGRSNSASGYQGTVGGGGGNMASADYAAVGGGVFDTASGYWATVPGGANNRAGGDYSFAAGWGAKVDTAHHGTFVWADHTGAYFASTGQD